MRRSSIALGSLAVLLGAAVALRLLVGGERVLSWPEDAAFLEIRLLRVVAGLVVGASLAMGGVMMQSLLRNPLASPGSCWCSTSCRGGPRTSRAGPRAC